MTHYLYRHFELLKQLTLAQLDLKRVLPSDCKFISAEILKKTHKQVSETTLKRVYGFAFSEFNPSMFTINAMAEFCGFESWESFYKSQTEMARNTPLKADNWVATIEKANRTTNATLHALKNRSGIPYDLTIDRFFIKEHLFAFFAEEATATVIMAPAGYGKTIAICHWIEGYLLRQQDKEQQDIILFFSGSAMINAYTSGHDLNVWLMALLGLDADKYINNLFSADSGFNGWFYLIIDGLDDTNYKGGHFADVLSQLIDIIALYHATKRLKVIVTMRSATWTNSQHMIVNKNEWFTGFTYDLENHVNVPMLSGSEINQLYKNIGWARPEGLNEHLLNLITCPLFFQYHFQIKVNAADEADVTETGEFDIISAYVLNKIYKSRSCIDMVAFLQLFVEEISFNQSVYGVSKLRLHEAIKTYHHAYEELLQIGYLQNVNASHDSQFSNYVRFANNKVLEHAVGNKLFYSNNHIFDNKLLNIINSFQGKSEFKHNVLKWCIYQTITNNKPFDITLLSGYQVTIAQKADLISFVSQLLGRQYSAGKAAALDSSSKKIISEYFVGLEFINVDYEHSLRSALTLNLSTTEEILLKCSLCVIAIVQLDLNKIEVLLEELKQYKPISFKVFAINPFNCLDTVFHYLKYGIVKKDALAELTKFYFNPPKSSYTEHINAFNEVLYILAIHTLSICQNEFKALRFINTLKVTYPNSSVGYKFLIDVLTAETLLALGRKSEAEKIFNALSLTYMNEHEGYTSLMNVYFLALKTKLLNYDANKEELLNEIDDLTSLCKKSSYNLVKVSSLSFILSAHPAIKEDKPVFTKIYYDLVKTVRTSGCRTETFINIPN